jgi:molybdopterin/thiamine biosynthesis adenylyltransferase
MTSTLVLPEALALEVATAAAHPLETAGVLLASVVEVGDGNLRLLGRNMRWVDESGYLRREHDGLSIASHGYVPALALAETLGATPIWVHTHPGEDALPIHSRHDREVDRQLAELFRLRSGSNYYGALIFSPRDHGVAFTGYVEKAGVAARIERLWDVGTRLRLTRSFDSDVADLSPIFDRNIRAFGRAVQATLGDLHVGLVGCGGIGSAVAEQLVRLGVRRLTLVDPETLSDSNITRVYGSRPSDVGHTKVDVLRRHLLGIAPDAVVDAVPSMVTVEATARRLSPCDVVYGCTDDNAGRLVLSRMATYLLAPVIDSGVLLTADEDGVLKGIDGRVTVLTPGQACLVCRGRIDLARAAAELLTPAERVRRADEGYAPALGRTEPAVVTFTTMVAAAAVNELLERLTGYGPEPRPSEVLLRFHDRELSTNLALPRDQHYCHPSSGKLGLGGMSPFLEQAWSA